MSGAIIAGVATVAGAGIAAGSARQSAKANAKLQEEALAAVGTGGLQGFNFFGPGGQVSGFGTGAGLGGAPNLAGFDFSSLLGPQGASSSPAPGPGSAGLVQAGGPGGPLPNRQFVGGGGNAQGLPQGPQSAFGFRQIPGAVIEATGGSVFSDSNGNLFDEAGSLIAETEQGQVVPGIVVANADGNTGLLHVGDGDFFSRDQKLTDIPDRANPGTEGNFTPGGIGSDEQSIFSGLGDLDPSRQGLVALAQQAIGRAGLQGQGLPQNVAQADALRQSALFQRPDTDLQTLAALEAGVGSQFGQSAGTTDTLRSGFLQGLQGAAFQDPQAVAQNRLDLLRQQAQPFEERAFQNLNENLFSTGRAGTSGGGLQTEAFARGLAQADIGRQLAASAEGRAFQNQAREGVDLQGTLLNQASNRFNAFAGLGSDLSAERFRRSAAVQELFNNRSQQNFANQLQLSQLPTALQGQQLGLANQALTAQGGLNTQALNNFQAALAASTAQSNARLGEASIQSNIFTSPAFGGGPSSGAILGNALTANAGTLGNAFSGLFARTPPPNSGVNNAINTAASGNFGNT